MEDPYAETEDKEAELAAILNGEKEDTERSEFLGKMEVGQSRIIRFLARDGKFVHTVPKTYQNKPVQRIVDGEVVDTMTNRYIVIDTETESRKEKKFEVGFTTKRNFDTALKTGHRIFKCTRIGEGNKTEYTLTPV